jgi:serine phosphatase RsbU (regulator of sigma subunit)
MDRIKYTLFAALIIIPFLLLGNSSGDTTKTELNPASNKTSELDVLLEKGAAFLKERNYEATFKSLFEARDIAQEANNGKQLAKVYYQIGQSYYRFDNSSESIRFINKALIIPDGLTADYRLKGYATLGNNYSIHNDYHSAIEHYQKAIGLIKPAKIITGKNYAYLYNNIALSYSGSKQFDKAREYHNVCLQLRLADGDEFQLGQTYNNIGTLYYEQAEYDSALFYFDKGLVFRREGGDPESSSILESQINMGKALIALKKYALAKSILTSSLNKSLETNNMILELRTVEQLAILYSKTGNYEDAFSNSNRFHLLKDSLFSMGQKEDLIRLATVTQFEEQMLADSLIRYEQKVQQDLIAEQEKKTSNFIKYGLISALILVLGIMLLIYRNYVNGKKTAAIILSQKELAEKQKLEIDHQHKELQQTHKEITDSIAYAKRIQQAILPPQKVVKEYLQDSFILYKPKDVVAGDFYWMEGIEKGVLFAAADCTGHGVPGAMVSVVCNNALNRSVRELKLTDPGEILNSTRDIVIAEFEKSDEAVSDGMDIALCLLEGHTLKYAGAHNPLWLIRDGELLETKANKQPIGKFYNQEPYTTHTVSLKKGDTIYIFSDGYVDQFGGEKGKKLKAANFKKLLLSLKNESMSNQFELLNKAFNDWKGNLEQLDDVCVIGVRI